MLTSFFMTLKGIPFIAKCLITVFVGMLPIIEIRGAIPLGYVMGLNYWVAYLCSFIGNIIPIFFIVKCFAFYKQRKPNNCCHTVYNQIV